MRWVAALLLIPALLAQTNADLFNDAIIQEFRLTMKPADFDQMKARFLENDYYPADVRWLYNGRYLNFPQVGVRSRGYGSRNPNKMNLRLDFNRYVDDQKMIGHNALVFKANNQDVSMIKERTVFRLWERGGLPTPREMHARVYINEQYYGMYLMGEEIDKDFLDRTIDDDEGDLFGWTPLNQVFHFEWNPTCTDVKPYACSEEPAKWVDRPFSPETNEKSYDIKHQINLIKTASTASDADYESAISPMLDLKLWLFHNALEVFVADFDSILGDVFGANNFYLYRYDKSPLQQFLVWDKDNSYDYVEREIYSNFERNPLLYRTMRIPARRTQYLESLYKASVLAGGPGGWMEYENRRLYEQIRQGVYDDPNKQQNTGGQYLPSTNQLFDAKASDNAAFIRGRAAYVLREITAQGYQPASTIQISNGGVGNATGAGGLVPGSLASIYGSGLATATVAATGTSLPKKLSGVSVIVNGFEAPLLFISPTQINFQVPWELGLASGTAPFTVTIDGPRTKGTRNGTAVNATFSNSVTAPVKAFGPGIFLATSGTGSLITNATPVTGGDVIVVYCTGLGAVKTAQTTGALASLTTLVETEQTPEVTIGGARADVLFSGLTPGTAGVYQINLRVPQNVIGGGAPLVVTIGGEASTAFRLPTR